ncbi:hypothetical protein GCM10028796_30550 [Ramlibacter monticola]|uniref:Glycosyltransferase family 2 protein n=1 Tax=Ramlibacter monticola TaxID=1926872 RepID=A0A936Z4E6_9BURK|nr:glycosyltransferase family 2 protein [Ramlibacter monticola]MBL0394708.1 glycosyltransferase family 2 protein [Ramlibacter monticola]
MHCVNATSTCVVIVNWNGWRDTVVCLESLLALEGGPMHVIVCDNASTDGSVAELHGWLRERLPSRPMSGQGTDIRSAAGEGAVLSVHVLPLPSNLGYAGGLNAGIRWARERWSPGGFWLLNNDVQAQPRALDALLAAHAATPDAGICGSILLDWEEPRRIQAVAGIYSRWLGVGWHERKVPAGSDAVSMALDYPVGASLYVSSEYLDRVGLMDASYFLYYEEMDWVERGRRHGYRPLVALGSRLRHKEGASTGSHGGVRNKSLLSEHYGVINRLRITRKFWPHYLPIVWLSLFAVALDRFVNREWDRAGLVLRLMASPLRWLR